MKTTAAKATKKSSTDPAVPPQAREVTRYIKPAIQAMLWGKAGGRCEFMGCNKPLWKSPVSQDQVNIAEMAHIYAFSPSGPRGNKRVADEHLNSLANLLLVCPECHTEIDKHKNGGRYTVPILRAMKAKHETRIEIVTGVDPSMSSHVVLYGANIGQHSSPLNFDAAAFSLFPGRFPAEDRAIELAMVDSPGRDKDADFWRAEAKNLIAKFNERVRERLARGDIDHLSIFALAPQALLILFGSLLTDIPRADVFQLHREPPGWGWPDVKNPPAFQEVEPAPGDGPPALVLALSATVAADRITTVLGPDARIWTVTIPEPNNDSMKTREQLAHLRTLLRRLLDRIKARHGQTTTLHVFPAASVSACVEFGRIRQPKADMPLRIYDQVNDLGGFVEALSLPSGD